MTREQLNVLVIAPQPFFQERGTPIAVRELVKTLSARGCVVDIAAFHEGEDIEIENCKIHRIPAIPGVKNIRPGFSIKKIVCDFFLMFKAIQLAWRNKYDIVHAVEEGVFIAMVTRLFFGLPYVYDMDSSLSRQLGEKLRLPRFVVKILRWPEGVAIRNSIGVVAVCESLKETARQFAPNKIIVTIQDKSLLRNIEASGTANAASELRMPHPIIMYVGNFEAYQGIDLLLESHRLLLKEAKADLVLIGGPAEKIKSYQQKAAGLGIGQYTHFLGPRPPSQLGQYLRQAAILVSPRILGDNTPMKIYSYLDSGVPVVATRLQTHTQVLDDEIAMLVEPDASSMANGLATLLDDAELRELLAYRAKLRIDNLYSDDAFDRKLNDFYGRLATVIQS